MPWTNTDKPQMDLFLTSTTSKPDELPSSSKSDNKQEEFDVINKPKHYNAFPDAIEPLDYALSHRMSYPQGSIIKYVTRFRHKGVPLEDLKKARWFLNKMISKIESGTDPKDV